MNPFSGAARLWRARRESKAMVADYYRNEAAPMSPERHGRLMEWHVHVRAYSDRWDAYYCLTCGEWREPECECGPECPFRGRPERMHHDHESED